LRITAPGRRDSMIPSSSRCHVGSAPARGERHMQGEEVAVEQFGERAVTGIACSGGPRADHTGALPSRALRRCGRRGCPCAPRQSLKRTLRQRGPAAPREASAEPTQLPTDSALHPGAAANPMPCAASQA
jgi:hypothetical protein